nr:hypothetical protein [Segetibacter sp.]
HYMWGQEFFQMLDRHPSKELDAKIQYFEDEKHLTVPLPSTYYGLRFIFDEFEIDINDVFINPAIINEHNLKISKKLGVEINLDEMFVNTLGYIALHERNIPDIAVSIFKINTKNYPLSLNVWDSLADAYMVKGLTEKAKACYQKILSLAPNNNDARDKLETLK